MSKSTSLFIKEDKQVQPSNDVQNEVTAAPKRNFVQQPVTQRQKLKSRQCKQRLKS